LLPHPLTPLLSPFFQSHAPHRALHSFPTRRSSDLKTFCRAESGRPPTCRKCCSAAALCRGRRNCGRRFCRCAKIHKPHRGNRWRSEEHTSELQSLTNLVCRLLLEKKKNIRREVQNY